MQRTLVIFMSLIAAASAACDSKPGIQPDQASPPSSRFSVHQIDSVPGDGGTLAYGQPGRVQVAYTVQSDLHMPPIGYHGPINLPPEAVNPPVYTVTSCLSTDGATCLADGAGHTVAGDGSVWNSIALSDAFRGRVAQTGFMIHQLTMTRSGGYSSGEVVAREVNQVRWHFQ
jgi:hypothetical protein